MSKEKKRIVYVLSTLRQCGPTSQLLGLLDYLDRDRFEPFVLTLSPETQDSRKEDVLAKEISVQSLNLGRGEGLWSGQIKLRKMLKALQPDIVHTTGIRADTMVSRLSVKMNFVQVMSVRNFAKEDFTAKYGRQVGAVMAKWHLGVMRSCPFVVCCSWSLEKQYRKLGLTHLRVIQNGVDENRFFVLKNQDERLGVRDSLGMALDETVFLSVGSLIRRKDPLLLIRAFLVLDGKSGTSLWLLGDGPLLTDCKAYAGDHVVLTGSVTSPEIYAKVANIFVSASWSEGLPNAVLEAASCGLTLILSDIPQHREIFSDQPQLAYWFGVGDEEGLVQAMRKALLAPIDPLRVSSYVQERFGMAQMSQQYQKLYERLLDA